MMLATPYCTIDFKNLMEYKQAYDVMFQWNTLTEFLQCVSCHLFLKVTLTVPVKYYTVQIYSIRVAILPLFSSS